MVCCALSGRQKTNGLRCRKAERDGIQGIGSHFTRKVAGTTRSIIVAEIGVAERPRSVTSALLKNWAVRCDSKLRPIGEALALRALIRSVSSSGKTK